jgi:hypothetical protein
VSFEPGESVRMTDRYAAVLCRSRRNKVDWRARRGVVNWANPNQVAITWEGRTSVDVLPLRAIEKAGA